ncbi:type IVB secretion system protein IcmH/DotU [Ideonella sp. YS5]|uniref:type IVB secretion system protein IcmH/DotU n=1 Tax=Ideonella sp. YS5 TaxID=3453714 RepID=UPI003EEC5961
MNASSAPSLLGQQATLPSARPDTALIAEPRSLLDLMYQGFYMLFLLRNGHTPSQAEAFRDRVKQMLARVDRGAQKLGLLTQDVFRAKFAFCALLDEVVLRSKFSIRESWERKPLQLELFGEHMAGERFFEYLEELRSEGAKHIQALEVFHMCLLLGFQGRHALDGSEKLGYISGRLGDEILHLQGKRAEFAPHWAPPDQVSHKLRREVPLWVIASVFALAGLVAFLGLRNHLVGASRAELAPLSGIVNLAPQAAYVTITLP